MNRGGIVIAIAGLLLFTSTAWADEQTKYDGQSDGEHGTTTTQVLQQTQAKQQEVKTSDMEDANSQNMTSDEHKNMNMTGGHSSHSGNEVVNETPPNIPVLSTFGGIMLALILYGVWNKWLRKRERAHA